MEEKDLEQANEITISEIYRVLKPKFIYIFLISIILGLLSFIVTKTLIKPVYKSTATVIVNNRKDENSSSISNDELNSAKGLANVYGIVIKSDAVMQPVSDALNNQITSNELKEKVAVIAVNNTQVIEISVSDNNPETATEYANEIIKIAPDVITGMVEVGSVKVVSYPSIPTRPISPNVRNNVLVALVAGFAISSITVLAMYFLDKTFKSTEDVEATLGVPVIGIIPNVDSVKRG